MTVRELHLSVNQRLQEVASFKRDKLFPEEIDLALNKAQFRLLEEGVNTKFETGQITLSHVTALIQKNKIGEVILPGLTDLVYEDNILNNYVVIPQDLYWLINARAEVVSNPLNCEVAPILSTMTQTEIISVLEFKNLASSGPYFQNYIIKNQDGVPLYIQPPALSSGLPSPDSRYVIINNVIEYLRRDINTGVYWERYRDIYYPQSFVFVTNNSFFFNSVKSSADRTSAVFGTSSNKINTIYNRGLISSLVSKKVETVPIKNTQLDSTYGILSQNQFYKPRKSEPLMDQTHDYFIIYRDKSFIITRMYYDYIRKPRTISLLLNQSCELADTTHHKIVDLAVELLRLDTKDPVYSATVQDTINRTQ